MDTHIHNEHACIDPYDSLRYFQYIAPEDNFSRMRRL